MGTFSGRKSLRKQSLRKRSWETNIVCGGKKKIPQQWEVKLSPESPSQRPGDVNRDRVDDERVTAGREEGRAAVPSPYEANLPMMGRNGRLESL